jgi:hypothetical protein
VDLNLRLVHRELKLGHSDTKPEQWLSFAIDLSLNYTTYRNITIMELTIFV